VFAEKRRTFGWAHDAHGSRDGLFGGCSCAFEDTGGGAEQVPQAVPGPRAVAVDVAPAGYQAGRG
jgi:hypothetical protein